MAIDRRSVILATALVGGMGVLVTLGVWFFGHSDSVACGEGTVSREPVKPTAKAQFERARKLEQGGDVKTAVPLYEQAAKDGSAEAAVALSNYYERERRLSGEGSYQMSLYWARRAKELGIDLFGACRR